MMVALVLSACGPAKPAGSGDTPPAKPSGAKQVVVGIFGVAETLSPYHNSTAYQHRAVLAMYPILVDLSEKGQFMPKLAESWKQSADGKVLTFNLRKGAVWSDGKPITAHDVAYALSLIAHPDVPASRKSLTQVIAGTDNTGTSLTKDLNLTGVKVIDDVTLQVTLKQPAAIEFILEDWVYFEIVPKHVWSTVTDIKSLPKSDVVNNPKVFGGPFKLVRHVPNEVTEFVRNETYFMGAPKIEKYFLKAVPQASMAAALERGEVDMVSGPLNGEVAAADADRLRKAGNVTVELLGNSASAQLIVLNHKRPFVSNLKFRQALMYAMNRQMLVDQVLFGNGEVVNSFFSSANRLYDKELATLYPYNPARAKQLLAEAGWDSNREFVLVWAKGSLIKDGIAESVKTWFEQVGIKVKLVPSDNAGQYTTITSGEWDGWVVGGGAGTAKTIPQFWLKKGAIGDYPNPAMHELIEKGMSTTDIQQIRAYTQQIQELMARDLPILPIVASKSVLAKNIRLVNVELGNNFFSGAHLWDVK